MASKLWKIALAAALVIPAAQLAAQEAPKRAEGNAATRTERSATDQQAKGADMTIAQCLAISNQEEIALAKLATQHSQNPEVKKFAESMVKDHEQFLSDLRKFGAGEIALRLRAAAGERQDLARQERRADTKERISQIESQRTAAREAGGLNFIEVKREMAEKCLQSAEKNWSKHQGAEGDKCFAAQQVVLHQQMLDGLEVLGKHASPELRAVIDKGISSTQQHLTHAEQLAKELAQAGGQGQGAGARSSTTQPRSNN